MSIIYKDAPQEHWRSRGPKDVCWQPLELFIGIQATMRKSRCLLVLEKCMRMKQLKQTHAQIILTGLGNNNFALSRLLAFCSDPFHGSIHYSRAIFDQIENPTICICNTMLKAYLLKGQLIETLEMYGHTMQIGLYPDNYTLPYVLKACAYLQNLQVGEQIHGGVFKSGFDGDIFVGNTLMLMYSSCARMVEARHLFEETPVRSAVSWTVMISGYSKNGDVDSARLMFDQATTKDRGIWGCMISSYVQNNCFKEGMEMFRSMQLTGLEPDQGIFVSLLSGCAHLGSVDIGIWIHRYLKRKQLPMTVQLHTALIDMYAKCGNLDSAKNLFDGMQERDAICWNVMISGLTMHGDVENALALFEEMEKDGFRPNDITFIAVLTACSYSGMASKGLQIFDSMKLVYGIEPKSEHYGCMINILSRAGLLEEAKEIILRMPASCSPSDEAITWRALLSACSSHGETSLAEVAAERLVRLERHSGVYVLLSNMYAGSGKYDDAKRIRKNMKERGVEKTPGCSSIEVNGFIHEFVAGEKKHPQLEEIHTVLEKMNDQSE